MPNHYHLLLRQDNDKSISRFLKSTFQSYTQAFNKKYDRTGKLLEGNSQGKLIDDENYLSHLCRYIHLNPVDAGIVDDNEQWPYSNYLEFIDKRNGTLYEPEFINKYFSDVGYEQFILDYMQEKQKYREIR
ncbi:MAG: transposase [Candidatus Marinimicrobia bacterium]|nr:transposase [Candidatus Neomarinimicrobiota bacterium]